MNERWDRPAPDPAYLDSHTCAQWAYMLATEEDLRAAIPRLEPFGRHGDTNVGIVRDALEKRFPEPL